jgi:hypothetical protein
MTTKLEVYNLALLQMKASTLSSTTERVEARFVLDALWPTVVAGMLEDGFWKFAMRSVRITQDTNIAPNFGYPMAFNMPDDWVRTYSLSLSENFEPFLDDWIEESNTFFAHAGPLYVRYISNSETGYGMDMTRWTARFVKALAFCLAWRASPKATGSSDNFNEKLEADYARALSQAKSFEALRDPPKQLPQGRWNSGRFSRNSGRFSGGYRIR